MVLGVSISVFNPNPSYAYDWYVDGQLFSNGTNAVLPAGQIHLRATASPNCYTNSNTVTIYQPSQLIISQDVELVKCNGGNNASISVEVSGGLPPYSYSWSNVDSAQISNESLSNLTAGVYNLTVKDANSCERQFAIDISEPNALAVSSVVQDVSCHAGDDGSATLSFSGGTSPFSIHWQGVDSTSLSSGSYDVFVTDGNSCSETIEVQINQPTAIVGSFNVNQVPFTASANGGIELYTYEWLYFGNYQSSGATFSPSENSEYTLVVKDANDCEFRLMKEFTNVNVFEFASDHVKVYPNPISGSFVIEVLANEDKSKKYLFKLFDSRARILKEDVFKKSILVQRENLANGIYIVQIVSQEAIFQQKIIFE